MLFLDVLLEALLDTLKIVPFLFLTYLLMEYLEDKAEQKTVRLVKRAGRFGPFFGAAAGVVPQCGFSAAASSLYAGGVITAGTLLAIFLSTSDEMLPVMISETVRVSSIVKILIAKAVLGAVTGLVIDLALSLRRRLRGITGEKHIHDLCEQDNCHCEEGNIFLSALRHTLQVALFILILSVIVGLLIELIGLDALAGFLNSRALLGVLLAALIGLIPNCAASVAITELYLKGILGAGQMMAGLLVGAGVGLLVLDRKSVV